MKSIERLFKNEQERQPFGSTYLNFANAIRGQRISKDRLARYFKKLVDKNDYARSDKGALLGQLFSLSWSEPYGKQGEIVARTKENLQYGQKEQKDNNIA